ncbi:MAG: M15 family metallopeptidase [Lachnospiraceae bacterium]
MLKQQKNASYSKKRRRRKQQRKIVFYCILAFLTGVVFGMLVSAKEEGIESETFSGDMEAAAEKNSEIQTGPGEASEEKAEDWNLVLVNGTHFMEEGYQPELTEIENNYYFDARAAEYLKQMLADGRKEGLDFRISSAYRSMEKQQSLYENKVRRLRGEGMSPEEACEKAGTVVACPGTSEHQLGLAADIVAAGYQILDDQQADTEEAKWLKENCWKYGFILRYPTDKTEETGIIFEPWHYRYVGKKAAKEIMSQGICLEEYLDRI